MVTLDQCSCAPESADEPGPGWISAGQAGQLGLGVLVGGAVSSGYTFQPRPTQWLCWDNIDSIVTSVSIPECAI